MSDMSSLSQQQEFFPFVNGSGTGGGAQDTITNLITKKIAQAPTTQDLLNLEVHVTNNNVANIDNLLGEEVIVHGNSFVVESIEKEKGADETTLLSFDIVRTSSPIPSSKKMDT